MIGFKAIHNFERYDLIPYFSMIWSYFTLNVKNISKKHRGLYPT